ncbi:hypothetical protein SAMN05421748_103152 [Paractinoplanes atraurantiacus]|uniref:Uncharacterized protein n=1 Tax=Paractinoplanes atraurantiacus TaxID=1036182 RepID=A0A285H002_9ACTN|nr:hypothetical protein SAMN05421748_103152 [Actinoplanes atraurantiacus]
MLYFVRLLGASVLFGFAVLVLAILVLAAIVTVDSNWPGLAGGVVIVAVCLGFLVLPKRDTDDGDEGPEPYVEPPPVWDTIDGIPVMPDGYAVGHRWDDEVEYWRDRFAAPAYRPPHDYRIRPAVPPSDQAGDDG